MTTAATSSQPLIDSTTHAEPLHPALLAISIEDLQKMAPAPMLRRGLDWLRDHRVTRIEEQPEGVRAWFSAGAQGEPETIVTVGMAHGRALRVDAFDEPPWQSEEERWAYALAAVFAYQATNAMTAGVMQGATIRAIAERCKRARQEVAFVHQAGEAPFGLYRASSVGVERPGRDHYLVHLRSLHHRLNGCTCPDFRMSNLGMCKHTEAVRATRAGARRRFSKATVARLFDHDGSSRWLMQIPRSMVAALRAEGLVPVDAVEVPPEQVAPVQEGRFDRSVVFLALTQHTVAMEGWLEMWLLDARFDIGHDVLMEVERVQVARQRRARTMRWKRWFADWDGTIAGLRCTPFPYQREGIEFLVSRGRALLADDMGLGKTMQAIAASALMIEQGEVERVLVVCPTSLLQQWAKEIERFTGHSVTVIEGGRSERVRRMRTPSTFHITTYDRLRLDFDVVASELRPDLLVLDEAQRIKNWATKNAQHVVALQTPYAFVLTGTPLENKLEELYSLMEIVDPALLGPLWRFFREFAILDLHGTPVGYRNLDVLRERLRPVLLRRERSQVLDQLPSRTDTTLDVALSRAQRAVHDEAVEMASRIASIRHRRPLSASESQRLMAALQRARMACDSAHLVDERLESHSPKLETFGELIDELCNAQGHKVVVFSEWVRMGELAGALATRLGIGWVQLNGSVPSSKRGALIDAFERDPKIRLFISSDAGSTGLNLQSASALIHLDCPWNPAVLEQRSARIHRHGQKKPVQIIRLIAQGHYEGHVASMVESKRALFESVLGPDGGHELGMGRKRLDGLLAALESASTSRARATDVSTRPGSATTFSDAAIDDELAEAFLDGPMHGEPSAEDHAEAGVESRPDAAEDAHLEEALAAIEAASLDRDERVRLLCDLLDAIPADAELSVIEGRLVVAVGDPAALEHHLDLEAFAPLPIDVLSLADRDAVARYLRSRGPDSVRELPGADRVKRARQQVGERDATRHAPSSHERRPADPRTTSARLLWDTGQHALALELLWTARMDEVAAALNQRAPLHADAWRWLYTEALPSGAIDATTASALALAMSLTQQPNVPEERLLDAWRQLSSGVGYRAGFEAPRLQVRGP